MKDMRVVATEILNVYINFEYDVESGLYHLRARHYNPETGTFISPDPIGFWGGSFNLYAYANNNSVNAIDPFGLRVIYNHRIDSPKTRERLAFIDRMLSGIDIVTTGDDRFYDDLGKTRSSTKGDFVKGSKVSRHLSGNAVDFYLAFGSGERLNYTPRNFGNIVNQAGLNNINQYPSGRFHVDTGAQIGYGYPRRSICE